MAYVLGLITSDGHIQKNGVFRIINKERLLIEKSKEFMSAENPIYNRTYKSKGRKLSDGYVLQIGSKKMCEDLENLGVTPRKSKTIRLPEVPKGYFPYFLQGLIDGDGSVYLENYSVTSPINRIAPLKYKTYHYKRLVISIYSASIGFIEDIRSEVIKSGLKIQNINELKKNGYDSVYRISVNTNQAKKLGNFIYENILVNSKKALNYKTANSRGGCY